MGQKAHTTQRLIDARRGLKMFERVRVPVLGLVENMSFFICPSCQDRHEIFGSGGIDRTAEALGVPVLGRIPLQSDVVTAGDAGRPTVLAAPESAAGQAFFELAGVIAQKLSLLNAEAPPVLGGNIEWVNAPG